MEPIKLTRAQDAALLTIWLDQMFANGIGGSRRRVCPGVQYYKYRYWFHLYGIRRDVIGRLISAGILQEGRMKVETLSGSVAGQQSFQTYRDENPAYSFTPDGDKFVRLQIPRWIREGRMSQYDADVGSNLDYKENGGSRNGERAAVALRQRSRV